MANEDNAKIVESLKADIDKLRSKDGYLLAGLPNFPGLFGRDSIISSLQLLQYDPSIAKNTLIELARLQGKKVNPATGEQPGKILHEYYGESTDKKWFEQTKGALPWLKINKPVYFSVDSTPLFLILFYRYFESHEDAPLMKKLLPKAIAAIEWIFKYGMVNGFLRYTGLPSDKGLTSQSWKDGSGNILESIEDPVAVVEVQGYLYYALQRMAPIVDKAKRKKLAEKMEDAAKKLKINFNKKFWVEETQFFALALDGKDKQITTITSNPGHLLFTGIVDLGAAEKIIKRLFAEDMFTQYGIRTQSTKESNFDQMAYQRGSVWPHDNWIIAYGLKAFGDMSYYEKIRDALIKAYFRMNTMPEYYCVAVKEGWLISEKKMPVKPCDPQAWSAGALLNMLSQGQILK